MIGGFFYVKYLLERLEFYRQKYRQKNKLT